MEHIKTTKEEPSFAVKLCGTGINQNNLSLVQLGLWMGVDINYNRSGKTLLHVACAKGQENIVQERRDGEKHRR